MTMRHIGPFQCAQQSHGIRHGPHRWVFQPEDDSPERVTADCAGWEGLQGLLLLRVSDGRLSTRTSNALMRSLRGQRTTLGDVADLTLDRVLTIRGIGDRGVDDILRLLQEFGLDLRKETS